MQRYVSQHRSVNGKSATACKLLIGFFACEKSHGGHIMDVEGFVKTIVGNPWDCGNDIKMLARDLLDGDHCGSQSSA